MVISGISMEQNLQIIEEDDKIRVVDAPFGTSQPGAYYGDKNPDRTQVPEFNRQLRERQKELQMQEKKLRDMRKSEDLMLIYEQSKHQKTSKTIDTYR